MPCCGPRARGMVGSFQPGFLHEGSWVDHFDGRNHLVLTSHATAWACCVACLMWAWIVAAIATSSDSSRFLIYLSNWGLLLQGMFALARLYVVYLAKRHAGDAGSASPRAVGLARVLLVLSVCVSIFIVVLYWALLYQPGATPVTFASVMTHGGTALLSVVDVVVTNPPFYLLQMAYLLALGVTYVIWSLIYWGAGGTGANGAPFIYSVLDWANAPGQAAILAVLSNLLGVPLLYGLVWGASLLAGRGQRREGSSHGRVLSPQSSQTTLV